MQHNVTPSPISEPHAAEAPGTPRKKAPLVGVLFAAPVAAGLAGWTGLRIVNATQKQTVIATQRNAEAEKNKALAQAPAEVSVASPRPLSWKPVIELDGTLFAGQSAEL